MFDDDFDDDVSPIQIVSGEPTIGLTCERCGLPTAWSGELYYLLTFHEEAPRPFKTISGCICCDAPIKEPG